MSDKNKSRTKAQQKFVTKLNDLIEEGKDDGLFFRKVEVTRSNDDAEVTVSIRITKKADNSRLACGCRNNDDCDCED